MTNEPAANKATEKRISPSPKSLTSKQKQFLKGLAHPLSPLVQIGHNGVNNGVIAMARRELLRCELIKVKMGTNCSLDKKETALLLAEKTGSHLVQLIGKTIILFCANPKRKKEERIRLPAV